MHHQFVDKACRTLPKAHRAQPFGPETVVWKVNGFMFAAYTDSGAGLSVRTRDLASARDLIGRARAEPEPYVTGDGWVVLPWETPPDILRARIEESYRLVLRDSAVARGAR
jgi:predicted DNA-binding protein (MmcQ/YjbR family)